MQRKKFWALVAPVMLVVGFVLLFFVMELAHFPCRKINNLVLKGMISNLTDIVSRWTMFHYND